MSEKMMTHQVCPLQTRLLSALRCKSIRSSAVGLRLEVLGMETPCGRCGGTGHYSFNMIDGTICYGCGGARVRAPRLTESFVSGVEVAVAAGGLDAYFARLTRIAAARRSMAGIDTWITGKTAVGTRYNKNWRGSSGTRLGAVNGAMCDLSKRIREIEDKLTSGEIIPLDQQEELIAEAVAAGEKIKSLDYTDESLDSQEAVRS